MIKNLHPWRQATFLDPEGEYSLDSQSMIASEWRGGLAPRWGKGGRKLIDNDINNEDDECEYEY